MRLGIRLLVASALRIAYFAIAHSQDIYGQMVAYLRLNGLVPPGSQRPLTRAGSPT